MAVLLTGGAGFIGSHTAVELATAGYDVVIADDLSNSRAETLDSIESITGKAMQFHRIDVADTAALDGVFTAHDIDGVIHLAGFKAVGESVAQPVRYYRNNIGTTLTLVEAMGRHGVRPFVFSSSATVYGDPQSVPISEDAPTGNCSNPYGWSKYMNERILADAARADASLSVVLLRYFNPVGAHESGLIGEQPVGVPNNLMPYISQVAAGIRPCLSVFGSDYATRDGTGVRDYIHITDLARGHVAALRYALGHSGVCAVNLGTGIGVSVLEMVSAFERVNGVRVPYTIAPRRPGDIAECYADPAMAKTVLGWEAALGLDDMCRDEWRWRSGAPV